MFALFMVQGRGTELGKVGKVRKIPEGREGSDGRGEQR